MDKTGICESCPLYQHKMIEYGTSVDKPRLVVVGAYPVPYEISKGAPFTDKNSNIVKTIIGRYKGALTKPESKALTVEYRYAVKCTPFDNGEKVMPSAEDIKRCSVSLKEYLDRVQPDVVLLLGTDAFKALDIKEAMKNARGRIYSWNGSRVITTFHPFQVTQNPGLFDVFRKDVQKALDYARDSVEEYKFNLELPQTYEEVVETLQKNIDYVRERKETTGNPRMIAVDTETTSLEPHKEDTRMIAVSVSVKKDHGLAYLLDHREAPYTKEQRDHILELTQELLNPEYVKTIAANAKFDYKWLAFKYGLNMEYFYMDVLLAEHILDEDKKGEYSLKDLIKDYFPSMGQYEEELQDHFRKLKEERLADRRQRLDGHKKELQKVYINWWVSLSEQERRDILSRWMSKGYVQLSDTKDLVEVKTRKLKGEQVIMKKYENAVIKMLKKIPESELAHLEVPEFEDEDLEITYEDIPADIMTRYAAIDALGTYRVAAEQLKLMDEDTRTVAPLHSINTLLRWSMEYLTMPLNEKIAHMEYNGVRIDRDKCQNYMDTMDDYLTKYKDEIYTEIGRKFNLSSSAPELKQILFDEMGFTPVNYTATGEPSTDEETIKQLYEQSKTPFLKSLRDYRKIEKARNTYIRAWMKMSEYDGRLHANFHQNVAATYRLSSSHPNLQNVPFSLKEADLNLKALFIPDSDEYELYDLDIANAEMRVLCAYSQDPTLIKAFNGGMDIHSLTASNISDLTYEQVRADKEDKTSRAYMLRSLAKRINFGIVYGITAGSIAKQANAEMGTNMTEEDAQGYMNKFFENYPGVADYMNYTKKFAEQYKFVYTYTGRRRRFKIWAYGGGQKTKMERQAINSRIQTTSADIVNDNLVQLDNEIRPLGGRTILTVHDSILFQMPKGTTGMKELLDRVIIEKTREKFDWLPVDWNYDVGKGPNYGSCDEEII